MKDLQKTLNKKEYDALSSAERKLLIAEEVIRQIRIGGMIPGVGSFFRVGYATRISEKLSHCNLKTFNDCKLRSKSCHVCGIGGMVVAGLSLFNGHTESDLGNSSGLAGFRKALTDIFDDNDLCMIESAFECNNFTSEYNIDSDAHERIADCIEFGESHDDDGYRLMAIMQCIIDEKGERFDPSWVYEIVDEECWADTGEPVNVRE